MDATVYHWDRPRYPLQALSMGSAQQSRATSQAEKTGGSSMTLLSNSTPSNDGPAPWYRAVTDNQGQSYPRTSQVESDSKLLSYQPVEDTGDSIDESSTTLSLSHRSGSSPPLPSSPSSSHDYHSRKGMTESMSSSTHLPSNQKMISETPTQRGRKTYPMQAVTDTTPEHHLPLPTPNVEGEHEQSTMEAPESDQNGAMKRTLRRMPRSRQITSPILPEVVRDACHPLQSTENEEIMVTSTINPWKRQNYPLQSTIDRSTRQHPNPVPPEQDSTLGKEVYSSRVGQREGVPVESGGQSRPVLPLQLLTADADASPTSAPTPAEREVEDVDQTNTGQARESNRGAEVREPWHRNAYPLQAPASNANLRHLSTPPPSPKTEPPPGSEVYPEPTRENNQTIHEETKAVRRQAYPLQAPASNANLRRSSTSSTSSSPKQQIQHASKVSAGKHQENNQGSTVSKAFCRQVYPLQAPASNANLRRSSPPSSPTRQPQDANEVFANESQEDKQVGKGAKVFRRQVYPLQTSASITNLPGSPTPPSSPEEEVGHAIATNHGHLQGSNNATARSQKLHQVYPLQSPASVMDLRRSPLPLQPSPIGREIQNENKSLATRDREEELASKVINQWRRQVYPLQSPKNASPWQRSPTPQPPEQEAENDDTSRSIHLPRNIRAATHPEKNDPSGRTIVVCLDGTGDKFDNDNSNIVHLISALKKDDPHQVSYYQAGIGTYSSTGLSAGASAAMDMAIGSGLGLHVRDAYNFLMHSYKEGDKICIFGFSRGAYTARCLAGMIHKVGLLPARNLQQIPFAYEFYKNDTPEGWQQSEDFKKTFCIDVCVHFLGCFDSVASVGFIPRQLPLSSTPTSKPRYFRHAMALDERRAKFKICRHQTKDWDEIEQAASPTDVTTKSARSNPLHALPNYESLNDAPPRYTPDMRYGASNHPNLTDEEYELLWGHEASFDTDVLEVWFLGAHADVGGGAVPNDERHKLAQIPLRWMIRQAFECDTGIIFKTEVLAEYGLDVHTLWPKYERLNAPTHGPPPSFLEKYEDNLPPRSTRRSKLVPIKRQEKGEHFYHLQGRADVDWTPEQVEDFYDAMSPLNDQLVQAPSWWILELWPVRYKVPTGLGEVSTRLGMNLGRYRGVDDYEPNVHWTVLHRAEQMGYKIQARSYANTIWRTVV